MDTFYLIIELICVVLLIFFNAVFVCAEFAFVKARKTRMEELDDKGDKRAKSVLFGIEHLDMYLSVCQLGITLTSLGLGWLGEPAISSLIKPILRLFGMTDSGIKSVSVIIGFIIITFLHVVFGELAPKNIAIQKAENMVLRLSGMMRFFYGLFYPFVIALNSAANGICKLLKIEPQSEKENSLSPQELKLVVEQSQEGGHIQEAEEEFIQNVLEFDEKIIRDIMTPRLDVENVFDYNTLEEIIPIVKENMFTRYPVVDNETKVVGILHLKDAFCAPSDTSCKDICQEALFVPENMNLEVLLDKFKETHKQMAVVVDEFGIYSGIVTMEDVLEELVGEIQDEFNNETDPIIQKGNSYIIEGKMNIDEMCEELDFVYDSNDNDVSTVAGFALDVIGDIPKKGHTFDYKQYKWTVIEMDDNRIVKVMAEKKEEEGEKDVSS